VQSEVLTELTWFSFWWNEQRANSNALQYTPSNGVGTSEAYAQPATSGLPLLNCSLVNSSKTKPCQFRSVQLRRSVRALRAQQHRIDSGQSECRPNWSVTNSLHCMRPNRRIIVAPLSSLIIIIIRLVKRQYVLKERLQWRWKCAFTRLYKRATARKVLTDLENVTKTEQKTEYVRHRLTTVEAISDPYSHTTCPYPSCARLSPKRAIANCRESSRLPACRTIWAF